MTRQRQLDEIRQLMTAYGFGARDFLLTAPRTRGYADEHARRRIAQQLHSLGCSAHDLVEELPAGTTGIGEIGELVGMYASADRHGKFPVVELQTRNFESQHGSVIYVPVFRLVSWAFWEADRPAPAVALVSVPPPAPSPPPPAKPAAIATRKPVARSDMDDEIPFAWAAMAAIPLLALLSGSGSLFI
jgi:hypothetical protein